jgi:protein-S-isoprenylcysteine O-methyltransferase Ste14
MTDILVWVVMVLFPVSEIILAVVKRSRTRVARSHDRGSLALLWFSIVLGLGLANAAQLLPVGSIPTSQHVVRLLALGLMLFGLAVRWAAILTLGRLFTVNIAIHSDHAVVQTGLYRLVRHPSYTGLLIAFLGLGMISGNWLSILGLLVPITFAVVNRVAKEERALLNSLGPEYAAYCARTKRFVPGLF